MSDDAEVRLLSATDVRRIAAALGIRPTKRLGQNFVIDANTVRRIVRAAGLEPDDCVLEVGPGLGSLTLALLPHARRVVAVEIDPVLARALPATVAERAPALADRLEVVAADALHLEPGHLEPGLLEPGHLEPGQVRAEAARVSPTAVVANLPYNVAVPVLLHLFQVLPTLDHGLVMVQSEVADRLAAPPGSRTYGVPSVKAAWWARTYRAGHVPRAVFWPVPNVDSALVAFTRRDPPQTPATREDVFALVDAAFAQRRKSLRAALAGWAGSATAAEEALRAAGIDPSTRGEALAVEDFARLASHRPVLP